MLKIYSLLFLLLIDVGHIRGFVQINNPFILLKIGRAGCGNTVDQQRFQSPCYRRSIMLSHAEGQNSIAVDESVALEHRGVPLEHQGLHNALYGDGDDHGVSETLSDEFVMNDVTVDIDSLLTSTKDKKASGVFSIIDSHGEIVFVGMSRNLYISISGDVSKKTRNSHLSQSA
jgi:hypothetical protein